MIINLTDAEHAFLSDIFLVTLQDKKWPEIGNTKRIADRTIRGISTVKKHFRELHRKKIIHYSDILASNNSILMRIWYFTLTKAEIQDLICTLPTKKPTYRKETARKMFIRSISSLTSLGKASKIAKEIGMTVQAVRGHLNELYEKDLLSRETIYSSQGKIRGYRWNFKNDLSVSKLQDYSRDF